MKLSRIVLALVCATTIAVVGCGEKKSEDQRTQLINDREDIDPQILEEEDKIFAGLAKGEGPGEEGLNFTDLPTEILEGELTRAVPGSGGYYYVRLANNDWRSRFGTNFVWSRICATRACGAFTAFDPRAITNYSPYINRRVQLRANYLYNGWGFPYFGFARRFALVQVPVAPPVVGDWVQTDSRNCSAVCRGLGLTNTHSPDGAMCASGEAIPGSAIGRISFHRGCWPNCAPHNFQGARSVGGRCYTPGQKRDNDRTDRTVGCFCSGFAF